MPLTQDDDNWWRLSEGWCETNVSARAKWVFANKSNCIPYGTYVINEDVLRVETADLLNKLNEAFDIVRDAIVNKPREPIYSDERGPVYMEDLDEDSLRDGKLKRKS